MDKARRIGIVYPAANLDSVPSMVSTILLLAERGYWVDVFTRSDERHVVPGFENPRISLLPFELPERPRWRLLAERVYRYRPLMLMSRHRKARYACVIGVDPKGLIAAKAIASVVNVPIVYYSLELLLSYEITSNGLHKLKEKERALCREAAFTVIQDEERAALLMRDNGISRDSIICVPNAPLGGAARQGSSYLQEKFDLQPGTRIIMHAGGIQPWTGILPLIRSTHEWPDDWVLVCHTRYRVTDNHQEYVAQLKSCAKPGSVIFSTSPVSYREYPSLVRSADIGVAFYSPQEGSDTNLRDNIKYVGLSSGKVAYYLQAGLPVLVNNGCSITRLITTYGCGAICSDPEMTLDPISRILSDYDTCSRNAVTCSTREFDFAGKFKAVLGAIETLT